MDPNYFIMCNYSLDKQCVCGYIFFLLTIIKITTRNNRNNNNSSSGSSREKEKGKGCVAKYGDPYSEFVLCI